MNITTPLRVFILGIVCALTVAGAWAFINLVAGGGDLNGFQRLTVLGGLVLGWMLGEVLRRRRLIEQREGTVSSRPVPLLSESETLQQVAVVALVGTVACVGVTAVLRMVGLFSPITWQNWLMAFLLIGGVAVLNWLGRKKRLAEMARDKEQDR